MILQVCNFHIINILTIKFSDFWCNFTVSEAIADPKVIDHIEKGLKRANLKSVSTAAEVKASDLL